MQPRAPIDQDLVLVGGGHAHVHVLKRFGMRPVPGVRLTLVTRDVETPYSGMLPGRIAGHYAHDDCVVDLLGLCAAAGAHLVRQPATGLDHARRRLLLADGNEVPYDILSLDIGIVPKLDAMAGIPRPSHADYTYQVKYGIRAESGGGRASARETIARVAAGAIAEKFLAQRYGVQIVNGQVVSAAGGGADVRGHVGPSGAVAVHVQAGGQWANGSGRLSMAHGGGVWRGQGSSGACQGTWVAQRSGYGAQAEAPQPQRPLYNYAPDYAPRYYVPPPYTQW